MIKETVSESRSCRSFDGSVKVTPEFLEELVDVARLCPSASNKQPLKYRLVYEPEEVETVVSLTKYAGLLKDMHFPPQGHHPTAFIVICHDSTVGEFGQFTAMDVGIAAQSMMLRACEGGFGGCMVGAFDPAKVSSALLIPKIYQPKLILALGKPDEVVFICEVPKDGSTAYFRDKANLHFVPKRSAESVIIK